MQLAEAVAGVGASSAITNHLQDGGVRARVADHAVVIAGAGAVVVLHQTGVSNTEVGGVDANTASRLLEDYGEDEAVVDASLLGDLLNGVPDGTLVC